MEEESVKFYLAERVPFAFNVTVSPEEEGVFAATASSSISWTVDNVRCAPGADSALQLQLCEKLKLPLHNRELEYLIELHCRKSFDYETESYRPEKTEFRLGFVASPKLDLASVLKEVSGEEADVFLQVDVPDWQEYTRRGRRSGEEQQFKTDT